MNKVTKAVIPVAGFGTRFLPYTKSVPKMMLPIIDKPVLQFIVEEAVNSGITDILFVVGQHSEIIEGYFRNAPDLLNRLEQHKLYNLRVYRFLKQKDFFRSKYVYRFYNRICALYK